MSKDLGQALGTVPVGSAGPNPHLSWFAHWHKNRQDLSEGRGPGGRHLKQTAVLCERRKVESAAESSFLKEN